VADRSVLVPITLSDLKTRDVKNHFFRANLRNYARTFWPKTNKPRAVTREGAYF